MERILCLFLLSIFSPLSYAQPKQDLIFLSIGIQHYAKLDSELNSPSTKEFSNAISGSHSASRIAYRLAQRASWGLKLSDDENHFVTREDIWGALKEVLKKAKTYDNPLFVLYYNGHGIGEGLGFGHFLIPGDFVGPYPLQDLVEADDNLVVSVLGILELIDQTGIPSLVLLDTCYEADEQNFEDTLTPELESFGNDIANILKALNSNYPAVTASEPTSFVNSITDPDPRLSHKSVGPLARRFLLSMNEFGAEEIRVQDLVEQLKSASLDQKTKQVRVQPEDYKWLEKFPPVKKSIEFQSQLGSGITANVEILNRIISEEKKAAEHSLSTDFALNNQPVYAKVSLIENSFGSGRPASVGQVNDETDLVFSTSLRNAADFSTSDSDVSSFSYDFPRKMLSKVPSEFSMFESDRYDDKPGIGLSFRGTTCEVKQGKASNVIITVENEILQTLSMNFKVLCTSGLTAEGTMDVVW